MSAESSETTDREAERIVSASRFLSHRGWAPAGSGNYSHRRADGDITITVSGEHKAWLDVGGVMTVDAGGKPRDSRRPSAETPLHVLIYRLFPQVRAVLHTHSVPTVVLSRLAPGAREIRLAGYELLKAFPGVATHESVVELPMVDNSQDMAALSDRVERALAIRPAPVFLIRDHGLYGWGRTMDEALRVVEAAETMIACEVELRRAGGARP